MKLNRLIDSVLFERSGRSLTLFYNIDISISETPEAKAELENPIEPEQQQPPQELPPEQQQQPMGQPMMGGQEQFGPEIQANQIPPMAPGAMPEETIYEEEEFTSHATGTAKIPENYIDNIQSLEDLLDFLSTKLVKNKVPVLDAAVSEIVLNIAAGGAESISDIINKKDRIIISIDYGKDKDNSVGFKVMKASGSNTVSLVMKKDGKVLPGKFDTQIFNQQVLFYRNAMFGA
jgi:hypothetical protein